MSRHRVIRDKMADITVRHPTLRTKIACFFGFHEWVSRVSLGVDPVREELEKDPTGYFWEFAVPVCRHCPKQWIARLPK